MYFEIGNMSKIFSDLAVIQKLYIQSKAMEVAQNGMVITDKNGYIIYANPYISKLSGYLNEELVGQHTRAFKSGKHNDDFYKNLWDTVISGKKWSGQITNKRKDGTTWDEILTITPITDSNGDIEFFIAIQEDITEFKKLVELASKEKSKKLMDFLESIKLKST